MVMQKRVIQSTIKHLIDCKVAEDLNKTEVPEEKLIAIMYSIGVYGLNGCLYVGSISKKLYAYVGNSSVSYKLGRI